MNVNIPDALKRLLYTSEETRIALGISARKLWGITKSGELKHVRIGRSVRYSVRDIEEWIDAQTKGGAE